MSNSRKNVSECSADPVWTPKLHFLVGQCQRVANNHFPLSFERMQSFQTPRPFSPLSKFLSTPTCLASDNDVKECNGNCSSFRESVGNGQVADSVGVDSSNYLLAKKCFPRTNYYGNCKYKSFTVDPRAKTDSLVCLSDSNSSLDSELPQVLPTNLEYDCDSATDSWTSSNSDIATLSSLQADAPTYAFRTEERRGNISGAVSTRLIASKPVSRESAVPLCPSLFRNVPPSIRFRTADDEMYPLPIEVRRLLHWKLSTITPIVVRQMVVRSGFRLATKSVDWSGTWGKHMKSIEFRFLKDSQKVNHFPGSHHLGRKDNLLNHIRRSKILFGEDEYNFLPETYLLPKELKQLHQSWKSTPRVPWIVKPPASARGLGIYLVCKWPQVPKKQPSIVQRYIPNPYLINGSKFDLRVYALVTDFNPLKIYIYPDGLVRFASVKYSYSLGTLSDRFMHLTNYSVNKKNSAYVSNEDENSRLGHKWTLKALWGFLKDKGVDVKSIWDTIVDIVIKTIVSAEGSFNQLIGQNMSSHYNCFELFGFDIMLDDALKPWLLEVNISPSLHASSNLDASVKTPMVRDMFNLVGYHVPDRMSSSNQQTVLNYFGLSKRTNVLCINRSYYRCALASGDRSKQEKFLRGQKKLSSILEELTPDDVRKLMQSEDEIARRGRFVRIFPCTTSLHYLELMLANRYYNLLLLAWELQYSTNREEGISHLQAFADADYHLKSSWRLPLLKDDLIITDDSDDASSDSQVATAIKRDGWTGRIGRLVYKTGSKTKRNGLGLARRSSHRIILPQYSQQSTS